MKMTQETFGVWVGEQLNRPPYRQAAVANWERAAKVPKPEVLHLCRAISGRIAATKIHALDHSRHDFIDQATRIIVSHME